jgi:chaperonin GroES
MIRSGRLLIVRQQLRPLFDRVVIKELDPDRVRRSGLIVPPGSEEPPPQHGIVLAVGPGLDWWENVGIAMPVRPGDHVVFPASAGAWIEVDEERLLVCRVGELLGVLESVENCPGCGGRPLAAGESSPVCGRVGSIA